MNTTLYQYNFTDTFGNIYETVGISEQHDVERKILTITKLDGLVTPTSYVSSFTKTRLMQSR